MGSVLFGRWAERDSAGRVRGEEGLDRRRKSVRILDEREMILARDHDQLGIRNRISDEAGRLDGNRVQLTVNHKRRT